MIHPARRLLVLVALTTVCALLPAWIDPRLWSVWAASWTVLLLATVADALLLPKRVEARLELPAELGIGRPAEVRLVASTPGWRRRVRVAVRLDLSDELRLVGSLDGEVSGQKEATHEALLEGTRRAVAVVRAVWFRWRGPLGLVQRVQRDALGTEISILPDVMGVRIVALRLFSNPEHQQGMKVERFVGQGTEFDSLREYVRGLDSRSIDWRATARHRRLVCRENRAERNHAVYLAFDTGHLMSEPMGGIPKLDHAINAALSLAYVCLRTGDRVGLQAFDSEVRLFDAPTAGVSRLGEIRRRLAGLDYSGEETNFTLALTSLLGRLRRRSLVILFTDFVDSVSAELMLDNARRLVRRHVVLFVALRDAELDRVADRRPQSITEVAEAVSAHDVRAERRAVLERLRRLGVLCLDVPPERLSAELVDRYLHVKRRELV